MRVLVCGSRTWDDDRPVFALLDGLASLHRPEPMHIIEGGARGADSVALRWAGMRGDGHQQFRADWNRHGRGAGPIRNKQMLVSGLPELVLAFTEQPPTPGTANMIGQAKAAGVPVWVVSHG